MWVFSKEQSPAVRHIIALGDAAIRPLVRCIGDTTPTLTKLNKRAVPLGVVCFEVLNRMIYHEESTATGDMDPAWAGDITPEATPDELRRAQRAWEKVVKDGTFHRN